jgi:hypothetical protein
MKALQRKHASALTRESPLNGRKMILTFFRNKVWRVCLVVLADPDPPLPLFIVVLSGRGVIVVDGRGTRVAPDAVGPPKVAPRVAVGAVLGAVRTVGVARQVHHLERRGCFNVYLPLGPLLSVIHCGMDLSFGCKCCCDCFIRSRDTGCTEDNDARNTEDCLDSQLIWAETVVNLSDHKQNDA